MKKKLSLILIVVAVIAGKTNAQTEMPAFLVSAGGGLIIKENFSSSYSIGELFLVTDVSANGNSSQNLLTSADGNPSGAETINNVSVYPNPSSGTVNINLHLKEEGKINIQVYDVLGKKVFVGDHDNESVLSSGVHSQKIELDDLNNGLYFMEISFVSSKGISSKSIQKINLNK